jgi:hypothetical protein
VTRYLDTVECHGRRCSKFRKDKRSKNVIPKDVDVIERYNEVI